MEVNMRDPKEFCRVLDGINHYIRNGDYEGFMRSYRFGGEPYNPNIIMSYAYEPVVHTVTPNLRITAELLRAGAELEYKLYYGYDVLITHRAISRDNWALICLILYTRGIQPFETIQNFEGKTAFDELRAIQSPRVGEPEIRAFCTIVDAQKQLMIQGDQLMLERKYHDAFERYNDAAHRVLTFTQGDENLIPFYQEEAREPFYRATFALISELSQPITLEPRALLAAGEQQIVKRLRLITYITDTVLRKLDKITGLVRFMGLIAQWQLPPTTAIDWSRPGFAEFAPGRIRSRSHDSALGASSEVLDKVLL